MQQYKKLIQSVIQLRNLSAPMIIKHYTLNSYYNSKISGTRKPETSFKNS